MQSIDDFYSSENILYEIIVLDTCHYTLSNPTERTCITPRVNLNVNYRFWVKIMCQCRLINCKIYATVVQDVDSAIGCDCVGTMFI